MNQNSNGGSSNRFRNAAIVISAMVAMTLLVINISRRARADDDDKPKPTAASAPAEAKSEDAEKPTGTATVQTTTARSGELAQTTIAYGSVTAQPGEIAVFSVPFECRVRRIRVTGGQPVEKGAGLIDVEPSPEAKLALAEAQSNLDAANKDQGQMQERFGMKLATNSDMLQSQQAVKLAQLRLDSLTQRGADEDHRTITADSTGLIARIDVQQGQIVPAGNPLVETVAREQIEVRLGVEANEVAHLSIGQAVHVAPVSDPSASPINGKIRLVTQRVSPDTRLVDVFVTPETTSNLLLDGYVRAELIASAPAALIVPRQAVLPDRDGMTLFTVKAGKAVKHTVKVAAHNDREIAVESDDLHVGDTVVVVGSLELEDGMSVETEGGK